jgi:peptidoglycan endopeptidase LytF
MQRYYTLVIFAIFLNLSAVKADQLRDSIGVENLNGKKLILHKIAAKDTYYSLGRRYGVTPKDIMTYNDNKFLQIGVLIKVPTQIPFAESNSAKTVSQTSADPATENTQIIEHAVQRKENLNMLAEKYGTTVDEIKRASNLKSINLQIGQILKIPAKQGTTGETTVTPPVTTVTPPVTANVPVTAPVQNQPVKTENTQKQAPPVTAQSQNNEELIVHTVASNETMYSIASKYNLTLDQLKAKNNLSTNSLYVGQKLLIKGQYPVKVAGSETVNKTADTLESVNSPSLRLPPSRYGLSQLDEKGTGTWITDPDLDSSKMLVLHRSAPVGTIMKITNPMSNRSTFAKVVGKFTENESTKDVIIVMTKAVADALGALDKRFLCNLTYSGQANEQ